MNTQRFLAPTLRSATAATLAASGYIHAQLYIDGYRFIHIIGPLFLLQASASFALATLLLIGTSPRLLRTAAAGVALGALGGFTASRTVGVFGFTEHGLQPEPQAVLSLLAETGTLLLLAIWQVTVTGQDRAARPPVRTPNWATTRTPPN
ncbi:hypothetical protein OHA79_39630 [Streptomyces sp. NBC_00841]|uniref:hypothetical protein n=1 Tax=Streptomyces sp. NBC_00841 TaxID=2975847 RepID=UPI002DD9FF11|nr:hypothetical protein [Streptomyces sp. NBC_00841]WSA03398.1 hypothetical protein OHA79_39630 [Streptomyces sp. NBC_00841]